MLTRLEVKGFKNLLDVTVDFGAFTCIAGENGIGKSNIFDAIEFLSHLATDAMVEASQKIRGSASRRGGDPRDLFWDGYRRTSPRMELTVEMLVPAAVEDDLGAEAEAATTFLRYQLQLGYEPPSGPAGTGRLVLLAEDLHHIAKGVAAQHLPFPHGAGTFRQSVVTGQRRGGPFLSTEQRDSQTIINVHGDGGSRGRPQPRAAGRSGRTVLSTVTTNDYPTILAARREMQSWRRLALEPSAMRAPDGFDAPRSMSPDGGHIAAALHRVAHLPDERGREHPEAVYARVANRLSDLQGIGVRELTVDVDRTREVFTLVLVDRSGLRLPARALSEGTLRFLALCVLLEDPDFTGLLCMEEPENGIHPGNLTSMIELVRDLAVDTDEAPGPDNPFRQVIINTHSPGVVQLCAPADLLLAQAPLVRTVEGLARSLVLTPFRTSWRAASDPRMRTFSSGDVVEFLTAPPGAQLVLPFDRAS